MICKIGFMQGRLCEPVNGLIQAFPSKDWEREFETAESIEINLMEWTLDSEGLLKNPFLTYTGQKRIQELKKKHIVDIKSVTGDCFMQNPFWKSTGKEKELLHEQFISICNSCNKLGVEIIVIPLVDNGSLDNSIQENELISFLKDQNDLLKQLNLKIAFESDYPPNKLANLILRFSSNQFGINYDTGNSASFGFNPVDEFSEYGHFILNIHIKDRLLGGKTVALNQGNTDFDCVFKQLDRFNYSHNFILQTARANDGNHAAYIKKYFEFTKQLISRYISPSDK